MPPANANANTPVRKESGNKTPVSDIEMTATQPVKQWHDGNPVFSLYERLGFKLTSVSLYPEAHKETGKIRKAYRPMGKWKTEEDRIANLKAGTHYALITGQRGGNTVIDIDDPNNEKAKELMDLMTECNMVAKTNKGFHYVYNYTPRIKQTSCEQFKIDTRNDGGIIFCQPSQLWHKGDCLAKYEWIKEPMEDALEDMPDEVLNYLNQLSPLFTGEPEYNQTKIAFATPVEAPINTVIETPTPTPTPTTPIVEEEHELVKVAMALPDTVLKNYQDWLDIGIIFYNKKLTVADWDKVSKRPNIGYEAGACAKKWGSFTDKRAKQLTEATLWHKLKKANPAKFYELMETRKDFLNLLELLNSNDVAKYFYNILPDKYIYNEHLGWYSLSPNNTWSHSEKPTPSGIKGDISNTFQQLCLDSKKAILTRYAKDAGATADKAKHEQLKEECDNKVILIHKAYKQLGGADFCSGVISFLDTYYNDVDLETKMDMNPHLFAFSDGLYDLTQGKFRPITPSDFISTTTGYEYPKKSDKAVRTALMNFLKGLHEDEPTTDYLLKILASALLGYNKFEKFYVFTGKGGNGKGVVADLLKEAFGGYYYPADVCIYTKVRERVDQPIPALVEGRCKRLWMSTEPETNEKLQVSVIKKVSGGDAVEARTLHSKHIYKSVPMYKPFIQANDIPKLSKVDVGLQRRMDVVKFPLNFVPNPTAPHERQGDPDIKYVKCKSIEWRNEFMLLLTEYYTKHIHTAKSIVVPDSVKSNTSEYIDDNNPLKAWLTKYYDITNNDKDTIGATELKNAYRADTHTEKTDDRWFKQMLSFNGIEHGRTGTGAVYKGLKRKAEDSIIED